MTFIGILLGCGFNRHVEWGALFSTLATSIINRQPRARSGGATRPQLTGLWRRFQRRRHSRPYEAVEADVITFSFEGLVYGLQR
jgi:hypothetical protein